MTNEELQTLYDQSNARIEELKKKYEAGLGLTRRDYDELRHCVQRVGLVAKELWLKAGRPDDPLFEDLREPIKLSSLPQCYQPLTLQGDGEVH